MLQLIVRFAKSAMKIDGLKQGIARCVISICFCPNLNFSGYDSANETPAFRTQK